MNMQTPVVFLPGWGFQARIAKEYLPIVTHFIDLPLLEKRNNLIDLACDRIEAKLPSQPCILIGWSLGGLLQIKLYKRQPSNFKALIIISSTPCFREQNDWLGISKTKQNIFIRNLKQPYEIFFKYYLNLIMNPFQSHQLEALLKSYIISKDSFNYYKIYTLVLFESDLRPEFSAIKVPTLFIYGEKDTIISKETNTYLRKLNPSLTYFKFEEAGHLPFINQHHETNNIILKFLNGIR
ncbi:MAG: alpha/beta hydrolase [Alphaproteobacteria bacterium]|nr:alpha/beta hydrolase [Alphaproteobacteria bacterium]